MSKLNDMPTTDTTDTDESTTDRPDELGLAGAPATYDPADAPATDTIIRGTAHAGAGDWQVWIETADGIIETTDEYLRDVGTER